MYRSCREKARAISVVPQKIDSNLRKVFCPCPIPQLSPQSAPVGRAVQLIMEE
jgi:hypothetical protein